MAAYDAFKTKTTKVDQPAIGATQVTPDDDNDLTLVCRALYVGTSGNVTVLMSGDSTDTPVTFVAMSGFNPIMVKRVMATDTTATDIVALY